ncbi:GNAT family N-acetyltransferase [Oceanibacterium hippocampi]|uniref:N-acetyltransferase domain-containing protein n=1 Tax=Oceanibacterium hippocampi TaxID=745714 RepID=A0A1Y5TX88_9PROT|nr:N-acetyltransferase [Oceanibacterium hippocampi]SLN75971.1 hypothetical protein OCH7691_04006 [Oceanibacterium hippocampi]
MRVDIRDEATADRAAVRSVVTQAFGRPAEADLVERLRADGDVEIALVAFDRAGRIVGHVLFSPMTAPFRALGLAPVAVLPECQRSGIGGQLIRAGIARAAAAGWAGIFVLGEPEYYQRFGFRPETAAGFTSQHAGSWLMALALNGSLPATTGQVDYAPAFADLE